jgi:hypothetical protein
MNIPILGVRVVIRNRFAFLDLQIRKSQPYADQKTDGSSLFSVGKAKIRFHLILILLCDSVSLWLDSVTSGIIVAGISNKTTEARRRRDNIATAPPQTNTIGFNSTFMRVLYIEVQTFIRC